MRTGIIFFVAFGIFYALCQFTSPSAPSIEPLGEVRFSHPCEYRSFPIVKNLSQLPPPRIPPSGLSRYRNEELRFSLFYPSDFHVDEFTEAGGARTIIFQNPSTLEGFQIFVVP